MNKCSRCGKNPMDYICEMGACELVIRNTDTTKDELKKCNVCGAYDDDEASEHLTEEQLDDLEYEDKTSYLVECVLCGKYVCDTDDNDSCGETLNYDQPYCKTCLDKQTKFDCTKCRNEDCNEEWTFCYDCPEYIEEEETDEICKNR